MEDEFELEEEDEEVEYVFFLGFLSLNRWESRLFFIKFRFGLLRFDSRVSNDVFSFCNLCLNFGVFSMRLRFISNMFVMNFRLKLFFRINGK